MSVRPDSGTGTAAASNAVTRGGRTIAVASGKGGVGKTNIVANLAIALRRRGQRVIVVDADLGLANLDTLLGVNPRATLRHVLHGECPLRDVLVEGPAGIQIVPAASGFEELTQLTNAQRLLLLEQVDSLDGAFDVLLLDTGAGISSNVLFFAAAAHETMVVVTPEPTALTDAYALVKVLSTRYAEQRFAVVVNMARGEFEARRTFTHLSRVAERFLHVSLRWAGWVPFDAEVPEAVRRQRAVVELAPHAPVSRAFERLAQCVVDGPESVPPKGGLQFFFRRLLAEERA
ncbi:MAG: MinD/ParA family protein [Deltaproteobacteria bacterium]|nr:MAG: MinD/ParA family protein [Deltaproteobacteria bacterium]